MKKINDVLESMTFEFFGNGKHKISAAMHLSEKNALFLDVRSNAEVETVVFNLVYHIPVLHIPIDEIPQRISEIPHNKTVGVFCSSSIRSTMVYLYLRTLGFDNVRIIEGGYSSLVDEFTPGKLLKHLSKSEGTK